MSNNAVARAIGSLSQLRLQIISLRLQIAYNTEAVERYTIALMIIAHCVRERSYDVLPE